MSTPRDAYDVADSETLNDIASAILRLAEAQLIVSKEIALFREDYRRVHGLQLSDQISEMYQRQEEEARLKAMTPKAWVQEGKV